VRGVLLSLLLSVGYPAAASSGPDVRQPIGPWNLDYEQTQCTALRDYGSAIVPAPEGDIYELVVGYKGSPPAVPEEFAATVDFGSGPIKAWLLRYKSKNGKLTIYQFRITSAEMARSRVADSVTLHVAGGPDLAFELDSIPALLDGLQKCTADLMDYWNVGGEKNGRIATPSRGDVRNIFSSGDYPREAMNHMQEGRVQFLLLVDEKGKVAGCHVVVTSGAPILDATGCAVIRARAKFKPALDASGTPVRSTVTTPPIWWRL